MSLSDILSTTGLRVIVDGKIALRPESNREQIAVKLIKADDASDLLTRALNQDETPLAVIPDSGSVYIMSPGTHGMIYLQGPSANKTQKATMEKLAEAYNKATGLLLPDWYSPKLDADKVVKQPTIPEEVEVSVTDADASGSEVAPDPE